MATREGFALKKKYWNECDPETPLTPQDPRYVNVDADMPDARGQSGVDRLAKMIEVADEPVCAFFGGLPGSGKSTEINRLADRLRAENAAHLLPIVIDAEEMLDLHNPIAEADILSMILYKADAAVLDAEHKDPKQAMAEGPGARFWHWLTTTEVGVSSAEIGPSEFGVEAKVSADFKTNPSLRDRVRRRVSSHMTTFLREAWELLLDMNRRARSYGYEGIVIIVDSLEKINGLSTNWREVLASAEKVFGGGAPYLKLPVHIVYTVPPALVNRMSGSVFFLPMLKIRDREGNTAPGTEAARQIIRNRVPDDYLAKLFGKADLDERVSKLIDWSGGYPREILKLLQDCILEENVDERSFRRIIARAGERFTRVVPDYAFPLLAQIALEKRLIFDGEEQRSIVDFMLQTNVILRYQNDEPWVDLHPAVRAWKPMQDAIAKAQK
ncbi:MAG TPA: hypothetical protein PK156_34555 [Polyangium sp.]|nr:hypothetical protein [Polyangium sp.]